MSYKTKLQTNNDNLEGNNIDLQSILNTINELPAAGGGTEDLDAEITEQEGLIEQIEAALVGKAGGGSIITPEYNMVKTTLNYNTNYNITISYLGLNENGLLENKIETLDGTGSIVIETEQLSLIDCNILALLDPTLNITWVNDNDVYGGYEDASEHYNVISYNSCWVVLYPGGVFTITALQQGA